MTRNEMVKRIRSTTESDQYGGFGAMLDPKVHDYHPDKVLNGCHNGPHVIPSEFRSTDLSLSHCPPQT